MKGKNMLTLLFALVALLSVSMLVSALPNVEYVKINGDIHEDGDTFVVDRGDELEIRVKLDATMDEENVEVSADIFGYEYNDRDKLSDTTHLFDMEAGDTTFETLELQVPNKIDKDYYDLRVRVASRTGPSYEATYRLRVEGQRNEIEIRDVLLHPDTVEAGSSLLANVRVTNRGERDADDVKVTVRIPALNIEDSDYISELEQDESKTSEELFLRIPACAAPGQYNVEVTVEYDEGFETVSTQETFRVVEGRLCNEAGSDDDGNTIVSVGNQAQTIVAGQSGATYSLAITNTARNAKTYMVGVSGVEAWGTYSVTPSTTVVVQPGETKAVFVSVAANKNAAEGQKSFVATVTSGAESETIQLTAAVQEGESSVRAWAEFVLIALVVLLVILGLIIGFSRMRSKDDDEDEELSGQTYY